MVTSSPRAPTSFQPSGSGTGYKPPFRRRSARDAGGPESTGIVVTEATDSSAVPRPPNDLPFSSERRGRFRAYHGRRGAAGAARGVAARTTCERRRVAFVCCNGLLASSRRRPSYFPRHRGDKRKCDAVDDNAHTREDPAGAVTEPQSGAPQAAPTDPHPVGAHDVRLSSHAS